MINMMIERMIEMQGSLQNKTRLTSVRMTPEQYAQIQKYADKHGISFNSYLVTSAIRGEGKFDPVKSVHMQNIINIARRFVMRYEPESLKELDEEENAIWSM